MMEDVGEKVGRMLNAEASNGWTFEGREDQRKDDDTIAGLMKNYPWWMPKTLIYEKNKALPFKSKSTFF
jgi:hypothetical protein